MKRLTDEEQRRITEDALAAHLRRLELERGHDMARRGREFEFEGAGDAAETEAPSYRETGLERDADTALRQTMATIISMTEAREVATARPEQTAIAIAQLIQNAKELAALAGGGW